MMCKFSHNLRNKNKKVLYFTARLWLSLNFHFSADSIELYHTRAVLLNFQDFLFKSHRTQLPSMSDRQQCASSALVDMNKIIDSTTIHSFSKSCKLCLLLWHILYIILHGDWTSTIESDASFISVHRFTHKRHPFWMVFYSKEVSSMD